MDTKKCGKCGEIKSVLEFYKNKSKKDGLYSQCKKCFAEYMATPAGKALQKASSKKYMATPAGKASRKKSHATPAYKASKKKYMATPAAKDLEKISRKKYMATPAGKATKKKYGTTPAGKATKKKYDATPAGKATCARARHTRQTNGKLVVNDLTDEQWTKILKEHNYCCAECGEPFTIDSPAERDHIVPPKLKDGRVGLGLTFENIQPLCSPCNILKSNNLDMGKLISWSFI